MVGYSNMFGRACTCPGQEHPGPNVGKGRGAPEIDIFEAERDKSGLPRGSVSQSAQFAPFSNQYIFPEEATTIYDPVNTHLNDYRGSAL